MSESVIHPEIAAVLAGQRRWCVVTADCLSVLPMLPKGSVDCALADPPYGCNKADWDTAFPTAWYAEARRSAEMVCIITGSAGLKDTIPLVGADFVDVISARNMNGMTRGPMGFCNWLACVVACGKPKQIPNAFEFVVSDDMPDHPSPKPIKYMQRLVNLLTWPGDLILDPFCGSGTTGVAAMQTGRRFIGIEIDEGYASIARRRIAEAADTLFTPAVEARGEQMSLALSRDGD